MPSETYGVRPLLEVIVTSRAEALEAEAGGAGRLELVRSLEHGGLTPSLKMIEAVFKTVTIPVRVMLRRRPVLGLDPEEIPGLANCARQILRFPIDGFVIGAIRNGEPDLTSVRAVLGDLDCRATFHRAFDDVLDKHEAVLAIKTVPQIDRVLTDGGRGNWPTRKARLSGWQAVAAPEMRVLVAAGLNEDALGAIASRKTNFEFHVGRAVREGQSTFGRVRRDLVSALLNGKQ